MNDGLTYNIQRTLLNFLIYYLKKCASKLTIFIYNDNTFVKMVRKELRNMDKDFMTQSYLPCYHICYTKNLYDHKHDLQALLTIKYFLDSKYLKDNKIKNSFYFLGDKFWNVYLVIVKIMAPFVQLLYIVNNAEKPSMGYVYKRLHWPHLVIKNLFINNERLKKPYLQIIE